MLTLIVYFNDNLTHYTFFLIFSI